MKHEPMSQSAAELSSFVAAYEAAVPGTEGKDLARFLPAADHPLYLDVLRALAPLDLRDSWEQGRPRPLEDYRRLGPALFDDPVFLSTLTEEEHRLRRRAAKEPSTDGRRQRASEPRSNRPDPGTGKPASHLGAVGQTVRNRGRQANAASDLAPEPAEAPAVANERNTAPPDDVPPTEGGEPSRRSLPGQPEPSSPSRDGQRSQQPSTPSRRAAEAMASMPAAGTEFLGFQLLEELGRGTFGRVYFARQRDLADRYVALKISTDALGESQTLSQLQHTNIVPIYSVHRARPLYAVCMPFFGATTLADLLGQWRVRDSLPRSGKDLVSTLCDRQSLTQRSVDPSLFVTPAAVAEIPDEEPPPTSQVIRATAILDMLQGLSYVDAVLWMALRLTDGLAHAHERGILHRDLKPANILLSDEGQPMLLDFGVAADLKRRSVASGGPVGGTLPYMAPEHLEALQGGDRPVDARSDLYSFGVILYELLTRRHPFPIPKDSLHEDLTRMIADRLRTPPALRSHNKDVSPALESIVRHCLEPDPERRYQTARELHEDLERQRASLPLRYAPEPSLRERADKWIRRHPRLTSATSMAVLVGAVVVIAMSLSVFRGLRLAHLEARDTLNRFHDETKTAQFLLNGHSTDGDQLEEGIGHCQAALGLYGVLGDRSWLQRPAVSQLPEADRDQLRAEVGDLLLLLARATSLRASPTADPARPNESAQTALRLNELAETLFPGQTPKAVLAQRAELIAMMGQAEEAKRLSGLAAAVPVRTVRDRYLVATEHLAQGRCAEALPLLLEAAEQDPQDFWVRLALGMCHDGLGQLGEARACYTTAIALWPRSHWAYFNRGHVYLRLHDYQRAAADFDQVLRMQPELVDAYLNRSLARQGLRHYAEAIDDLTRALDLGAPATRIYFMRCEVRKQAGDTEGARLDLEEGLRRTPADEKSWIARGNARVATDLAGALADFEKALSLNPRSQAALQNKAHVLSRLGRHDEAILVLNRVVALYPDYVPARAGRGVLYGRLSKWDAARQDAAEALQRDTAPANLYQAAGIYALCSQDNPDDRREAFRLLASALRSGFGFEYLEADKDLDPIRTLPEFKRLVEASRALQAKAPATP
jgi:serine/threonine protein kinase/tetratricopeptide (TPR) repeat protein